MARIECTSYLALLHARDSVYSRRWHSDLMKSTDERGLETSGSAKSGLAYAKNPTNASHKAANLVGASTSKLEAGSYNHPPSHSTNTDTV